VGNGIARPTVSQDCVNCAIEQRKWLILHVLNAAPQFHGPKSRVVCWEWGVVVFYQCELRQRDLGSGFLLHRFIVRRRRVILCKLRRRKRSARRLKPLPDSTAICVWPFGGALEPRGYSSFRGVRHPRRAEASESGRNADLPLPVPRP
jgi:hypothetical protein